MRWHRLAAVVLATSVLGLGCSGSDDAAEDTTTSEATESSATTEAETTTTPTTAEATTSSSAAETTADVADGSEEGDESADSGDGAAVEVGLGEWFIDTGAAQPAGTLTFSISNTGENPHALAVVRGDSYESLPQLANGAVDVDAVGADLIGSTDANIPSGGTGELTVDLEPGNYVFFCPIQFGPNSHAAAGQVLSVTVG